METIKIMKIIFLGAELFIYIQYKNYIHQHQLGFVFIYFFNSQQLQDCIYIFFWFFLNDVMVLLGL